MQGAYASTVVSGVDTSDRRSTTLSCCLHGVDNMGNVNMGFLSSNLKQSFGYTTFGLLTPYQGCSLHLYYMGNFQLPLIQDRFSIEVQLTFSFAL